MYDGWLKKSYEVGNLQRSGHGVNGRSEKCSHFKKEKRPMNF